MVSAQHICTLARVREGARHDLAFARYGKCSGGKCGCGEKTPCTTRNNEDPKRAKPTKFKWVPGDVPLTPGKASRGSTGGGFETARCGTFL